jgi:hypothetical protein
MTSLAREEGLLAANVAAFRDRGQRTLTRMLRRVELTSDGELTFGNESARVFIRVDPARGGYLSFSSVTTAVGEL